MRSLVSPDVALYRVRAVGREGGEAAARRAT